MILNCEHDLICPQSKGVVTIYIFVLMGNCGTIETIGKTKYVSYILNKQKFSLFIYIVYILIESTLIQWRKKNKKISKHLSVNLYNCVN